MAEKSLNSKTAIVTGASSGLGRELALTLGKQGVNVVCSARDEKSIKETSQLIASSGGKAIYISTDVKKKDQVEELVVTTIEKFGGVDYLYNCAGSLQAIGGSWEIDPEVWWDDVTTNLYGSFLCCHSVLPHMISKDSGVIFTFDGGGGSGNANTGASGYGCSKAAIVRLTESIAGELKLIHSGVIIICYHPGLVRTRMTENIVASPQAKKWLARIQDSFGTIKEIPIAVSVDRIVQLTRIACPQLSGRCIRPEINLGRLQKELSKIQKDDLLALRYRELNND